MVICVIESTSTCICFAFVCTIVALHLLLKKNVALKNKFIYGFLYFISANMMKLPDKINSISFHQKALNHIGGVMVSVLTSSAVHHGFESGQTRQ